MQAVINVVLPVFGIILAGYLTGRARLLGEDSSRALNGYVFYVALPALFFISMARVDLSDPNLTPFLIAVGGGMVATFLLALCIALPVLRYRLGEATMHGLSGVFANTGYMGIPLLLTAYGSDALLPGVIATVFNGAVVIGLGSAILEINKSESRALGPVVRRAWRGLSRNPLVLSAVFGLAWGQLSLPLPGPFVTFCELLADSVGPCALFAMGLFLVGRSVTRGAMEVAWLTVLKLLVHPAITFLLAFVLLDLDPLWASCAVILAALPLGALVFVLAQQYQVYVQRATATILISTVASVATLSLLMAYLGVE
jgi:predicted permease